MLGPVLRAGDIALFPTDVGDLPLFRAWHADLDVVRYLPNRFAPSSEQEEDWYRRVAASEREVLWSVRLGEQTIGYADMGIYWTSRTATTGTLLGDRSAWGKGYGSEVVRLRAAYAFGWLGLNRLEADSLAGNVAMHRALEKAGYARIGTRHEYVYGDGKWHDSYLFELLRRDWESKQSAKSPGPGGPPCGEETGYSARY